MPQFKRKPVILNAVQWTGDFDALVNHPDLSHRTRIAHSDTFEVKDVFSFESGILFIQTSEGQMRASIGDWIVCGVKNECWAVKPNVFKATYEPA